VILAELDLRVVKPIGLAIETGIIVLILLGALDRFRPWRNRADRSGCGGNRTAARKYFGGRI
jgi:hypothetical protein